MNLKQNQHKYNLRRYLPQPSLTTLIEQYWLVDWDLCGQTEHCQQNLPDPNCHLVIESNHSYVQWVVRNRYEYVMQEKGKIIGVKFEVGALKDFVQESMSTLVDQSLTPEQVFGESILPILRKLHQTETDAEIIKQLDGYFTQLNFKPAQSQVSVKKLLDLIKFNTEITQVEQLANLSGHSVRSIQRLMNDNLGVSPKWLIRKYRLHQALKALEQNQCDILTLVEQLDYTDQAHLIKDFKAMTGKTPGAYLRGS